MKIRKAPYPIDFLGNSPEFILRATPWSNEGRRVSQTYSVASLPVGRLVFGSLRIGGIPGTSELSWNVKADPGDGLYEIAAASGNATAVLDSLGAKVTYNPELRKHFDVSAWVSAGICYIKFTSLIEEPDNIDFYHEDDENAVSWVEGNTGLKRTPRKDWRAMAFFSIKTPQGVATTPEMIFEESGGDVHVSTEIIRAYMPKPDIPGWGEFFTAKPCPNATAKIRLYYGEMYADSSLHQLSVGTSLPTPQSINTVIHSKLSRNDNGIVLQNLMRSDEVTLVNGELQEYAFMNNSPDWETADKIHFYLRSDIHSATGIFGQDDNDTILTPHGTEQYIYVYNFGSSNVIARVKAYATLADGTTDDDWEDENVTLRPGVNRITVREDDSDVVALRVAVGVNSIVKAVRNYIMKAFDHGFHTFLMLNALNLYETFIVEEIAREESTEGERRVIAGRDKYGTSDRQTVFTARCHPRNAKGLKLLRAAFAKQDNLLLEGRYAWYVDMLPGSLTVSDEGADITECEFKFRLREKVNRAPQVIDVGGEINMTEQIVATDTVFK